MPVKNEGQCLKRLIQRVPNNISMELAPINALSQRAPTVATELLRKAWLCCFTRFRLALTHRVRVRPDVETETKASARHTQIWCGILAARRYRDYSSCLLR